MARKIITGATLPFGKRITILGQTVDVDETSLKCGVKAIAGFSLLRLANCHSAVAMKLPKWGAQFIRFEVAPGDPQISQGWRAELRDMYVAKNGEEVWYQFSTLLPSTTALKAAHRVVTAQWHEEMPLGKPHKRPPLAHRQINGGFAVTLWDTAVFDASNGAGDGVQLVWESRYETGVIHEYVYRIVWRQDAEGLVMAWQRKHVCSGNERTCTVGAWQAFIDRSGPIGFVDAGGYYFKFGVYTTHPFSQPLVVYHRGYRRGGDASSVEATEPVFGSSKS